MFLSLAATPIMASAQAPVVQPPLPPECTARDADPEKCVIQDGPPPLPILRKQPPPPPPPPAEPKPPPQQAPFTKDGLPR